MVLLQQSGEAVPVTVSYLLLKMDIHRRCAPPYTGGVLRRARGAPRHEKRFEEIVTRA